MRSTKTRGETFTRLSPGHGKLASGYLEATACSKDSAVQRLFGSSKGPFCCNASPMPHQGDDHRYDQSQWLSSGIVGKENDRRLVNKQQGHHRKELGSKDAVKSMALLDEASNIIKHLQTFVESDKYKAKQKAGECKASKGEVIRTKDQATSTEIDPIKLKFESSFESLRELSEESPIQGQSRGLHSEATQTDEFKCHRCDDFRMKLASQVEQKALLEEAVDELQAALKVKTKETNRSREVMDKLKQDVGCYLISRWNKFSHFVLLSFKNMQKRFRT